MVTFDDVVKSKVGTGEALGEPTAGTVGGIAVPDAQLASHFDMRTSGAVGNGVADDTAAIASAIATAGAGGTVFFPPGTYMAVGLNINVANQKWIGTGVTLKKRANGNLLDITADGVTLEGLTLDGNNASFTGEIVAASGADDLTIDRCRFVQQSYSGSPNAVMASTCARLTIRNSYFYLCDLYTQNGPAGLIEGNSLYGCQIGVPATAIGGSVSGTRVVNNYVETGASMFGIEIGLFGAGTVAPADIVVDGNVIRMNGNGYGFISLAGCASGVVSNNNCSVMSGAATNAIAGIEVVSDCVVVDGNRVDGGGLMQLVALNRANHCVVTSNLLSNPADDPSLAAVSLFADGTNACSDNLIAKNRIKLPSGNEARCINVFCNAAGAFCDDNVLDGNAMSGDVAVSRGVYLDNYGTMARTQIIGNTLRGMLNTFMLSGSTASTETQIRNNNDSNIDTRFYNPTATVPILEGNGWQWGTAAPTTQLHFAGEKVWNTAPAAAGVPGWVCVTEGTPGTFKAMAVLAA